MPSIVSPALAWTAFIWLDGLNPPSPALTRCVQCFMPHNLSLRNFSLSCCPSLKAVNSSVRMWWGANVCFVSKFPFSPRALHFSSKAAGTCSCSSPCVGPCNYAFSSCVQSKAIVELQFQLGQKLINLTSWLVRNYSRYILPLICSATSSPSCMEYAVGTNEPRAQLICVTHLPVLLGWVKGPA